MNKFCHALAAAALGALLAGCVNQREGPQVVTVRSPGSLPVPFGEPRGGWNLKVTRGDTRETVEQLCGRPNFAFADDVWIYWRAQSPGDTPATEYDTLVVVFVDGCVDHMRLVDGNAVRSRIAALVAQGQPEK